METHVVAAEEAVYRAGEYVFPRMSLHPSKAERPVELSLDQRARLQRLRDEVDNVLPLLTQAEEIEARELTLVRLLTPAAGENAVLSSFTAQPFSSLAQESTRAVKRARWPFW